MITRFILVMDSFVFAMIMLEIYMSYLCVLIIAIMFMLVFWLYFDVNATNSTSYNCAFLPCLPTILYRHRYMNHGVIMAGVELVCKI